MCVFERASVCARRFGTQSRVCCESYTYTYSSYAHSLTHHQTCAVGLELVYVLLDLNCEDVLLELVFK